MNERTAVPIVILISGRGSNMRALIEQGRGAATPYTVAEVLSDDPKAAGLGVARELGMQTLALPAAGFLDRTAYEQALAAAIDSCKPSLIVLAGFMRILSAQFVERYAGRILNIHPSLLPQFPGLHTHRRALQAGAAEHGATVHFVTAQLDGGPAIIQARLAVHAADDEARLAERVRLLEHQIYPLAVGWYCAGRLRCHGSEAWLDGRVLAGPVQYRGAER